MVRQNSEVGMKFTQSDGQHLQMGLWLYITSVAGVILTFKSVTVKWPFKSAIPGYVYGLMHSINGVG